MDNRDDHINDQQNIDDVDEGIAEEHALNAKLQDDAISIDKEGYSSVSRAMSGASKSVIATLKT